MHKVSSHRDFISCQSYRFLFGLPPPQWQAHWRGVSESAFQSQNQPSSCRLTMLLYGLERGKYNTYTTLRIVQYFTCLSALMSIHPWHSTCQLCYNEKNSRHWMLFQNVSSVVHGFYRTHSLHMFHISAGAF